MLQLLSRLFRRAPAPLPDPPPSGPAVDWAPIIWAYAQSLWPGGWSLKNSERADKECSIFGRGLAYGKLRIMKAESYGVTVALLGEQKVTRAQAQKALAQALAEQGLGERVELEDSPLHSIDAIFVDEEDPMPGRHVSGSREPFHWKEFLTVRHWDSSLGEMEAPSLEALQVLVRTAELLGFPAGSKHYANESPVPIEDIVFSAVRWEDPETHARYLDVIWRTDLVVSGYTQGGGRSEQRSEGFDATGSYAGEVLASHTDGKWWPKKVINNRPVYAAVSTEPTKAMLVAREKFRREEADWKRCGVEGCGRSAAWDVYVARFVEEGFGGESSMGGIYRSCDDPEHLEKQKTSHGGVKTTVNPTHHEKW